MAEEFGIPSQEFKPKKIPSKKELDEFFDGLSTDRWRAAFLVLASSGLRRSEAIGLTYSDVYMDRRMAIPDKVSSTKRTHVTFYNEGAEDAIVKLDLNDDRLLSISPYYLNKRFKEAERKSRIQVTPQTLREWFAEEVGKLGVSDRYIDAFCGRTPKPVLAKHYSDYSPRKLKEIYEEADLKVLEQFFDNMF